MPLGVALGGHGELAAAGAGELKAVAENPLRAWPRGLSPRLPIRRAVRLRRALQESNRKNHFRFE